MKRRKAWRGSSVAIAALLAMLWVGDALAATKYLAPLLDKGDGSVECTNCCTGSTLTTDSLVVGAAGNSTVKALANNATATVMYLQNSSGINSGNPGWRAPLLGDITTAAASSVLAGILSDETGGTSKAVFDTNPTINGITITGAVTAGSSTAPWDLPDGAIGSLADLANTIRKGTANSTRVATATESAVTNGHMAVWNTDGNLIDGGAPGGAAINPSIDVSPMTQVIASTTPLYCGMDGSCSPTENDVVTPFHHTVSATYTDMLAMATTNTTQAITVVMGVGACGSALNYTSKAQYAMNATAFTTGTPGGTTTVADGQCVAFKLTTASGTSAKAILRISVKQTAGT